MTDLLAYGAVRGLEVGLGALPGSAARTVGEGVGAVARRLPGTRRALVREQLAAAFPDRGAAWRDRVVRDCYRHFGRELAVLARMARLDTESLMRRTTGSDAARTVLREATAGGTGALVVTGHLGNWELAGAVLSGLGFPVSAVVKRQADRRFDRRLATLRRGLGVEPVGMSEAGRRIPRALREGRLVALVADQDAGGRGVFVPFLGRPASTFRGPARLALRFDVPLLFGALVRDGEGYRALCRRVRPGGAGPEAERPDPADDPELAVTRAWVSRLEAEVRGRPAQYFWFHRRWKTRPDPDREGS